MIYNTITFIFTSAEAQSNWNKIDTKFLILITEFFKKIGIVQVAINSVYRNDDPSKNSYHGHGQALDIHTIKYSNSEIVSFNSRDANYSITQDDFLFREFKTYFATYKFEYISPANVSTEYTEHNNIYRNYTREKKTAVLNKMINDNLPYETNRNHLHHLHLAINPNPKAKTYRALKIAGLTIAAIYVISLLKI